MSTEPLVSILIPVYNAGEYLRPSVQSILCQTYRNLEILIIDDGSTDSCMASIAELNDSRIRIITQDNFGRATALNRALEKLSGLFYATHDADDISHPQRIECQVNAMLENPDLAAIFTGYDMIIDGHHVAPRFSAKSIQECRMDIEQMHMPTNDAMGMFRVTMVSNMRYDPMLRVGAALDYILRLGELYPMMVLGVCLYSHRVHLDSTIRRNPARTKEMIRKILIHTCERRGLDPVEYIMSEQSPAGKFLHREKEVGLVPHFMESVLDLRCTRSNWQAMITALSCLRLHPYDPYYYKPLVYSIAPLALIKYYRSRRRKAYLSYVNRSLL